MDIDFEFIVESAPDAVLIVSAGGLILRVNAEAERIFDYPRDEMVGQPLDMLLPLRLRAAHSLHRELYRSAPATRPMGAVGEVPARRRDGSELYVDVSLSPATNGSVIAIVRDTSERRRMNQELRALAATLEHRVADLGRQTQILESILNGMGEGVLVCDQTGKLLLVNPAARRLYPGLQTREEPLDFASGSRKFGLFLPDKITPYPAGQLPLVRVLKGEALDGVEIFVRPPGSEEGIWITVTGRPIQDSGGNLSGGVVVIRDTTALKLGQGALLAGQEAEGKRIARELHDSVAQDLCTLILDMTQLHQGIPDALGTVSAQINAQREKLIALSDELDSVCRQLHPSVLERIGLSQAMARLCKEFTDRKGLDTQFSNRGVPASLPVASALCLYRVAQESLRNIVRHARTVRAAVTLSVAPGALRLVIEDQGVGFDPKTVDAKARLGLVSMQERVRLVGGTISIHSSLGNGTRIDLQVPLPEDANHPVSEDSTLSAAASSNPAT